MPNEALETKVARHDVLLAQHGETLKEVKTSLENLHKSNGEVSEMFGKIMAATTHTADQVGVLSITMDRHTQQVDRRFTELRLEQDRICALKHGALEQRIGTVEQGKHDLDQKVEDMGEITKVTYIRKLEAEIDASKKSKEIIQTQGFEWKKIRVTAMIGLVMLVLGGVATYTVNIVTAKASPTHAQPSGSR